MALTLYAGSGSPYSWRVWLALEHKRVPYELQMLSFANRDNRKPEFLALNPRHKVPVLVDGDFSMYESGAIVEYLDERFADGPKLFPGGVRERAVVRRLVLECDNYVRLANDKLTRQLFFRPEAEWDQGDIATGRQGWLNEIEWLEKTLKSDFLAGEISAADFTLYPYFGTLRRLETKTNLGLLDACGPRLLAWAKRIESLPYFGKTYPPHWKQ